MLEIKDFYQEAVLFSRVGNSENFQLFSMQSDATWTTVLGTYVEILVEAALACVIVYAKIGGGPPQKNKGVPRQGYSIPLHERLCSWMVLYSIFAYLSMCTIAKNFFVHYEHFMLKEIMEQPRAVKATMASRIKVNESVLYAVYLIRRG
ncbi:MAG: hypothetical protein IJ001_01955 [Oscillospiraceae bacterium]|nr:hypothetical protein [Oscillospiraceae bacterium]